MLEQVDLDLSLSKEKFKEVFDQRRVDLSRLQHDAFTSGIPVLIVFEGWEAAGKGTAIGTLVSRMDPRGFKVHHTAAETEEERLRPFLWRFWTRTPARGEIAIFDQSWYRRVLVDRVEHDVPRKAWQAAYDEINRFERQLTTGGTVILKFFLHIARKEQRHRFRKIAADKAMAWKVTDQDWRQNEHYDDYLAAAEDMLAKTSTAEAPWTVVEATDRRWAVTKIFDVVTEALCKALQAAKQPPPPRAPEARARRLGPTLLSKIDPAGEMIAERYNKRLKMLQDRLLESELRMYAKRLPAVVLYEGWDAAGKGGNIKRLVERLDPRGYSVIPIAAPKGDEATHHYLWRFWRHLPKAGHLTIFDRTWYGRVLVERVEGFCSEADWRRAYQEINEFEESLADFGMVIVKFWIHIDKAEQLRRFNERKAAVDKQWKLTDEDWRNREKWDIYERAVSEMLERTSTTKAPWTVIRGNNKYCARIQALETVCRAIKEKL